MGSVTGSTANAGVAEALIAVMSSLGCYRSKKKKDVNDFETTQGEEISILRGLKLCHTRKD